MKIILISSLNTKRVIGANGKIPWHIPEDIQRFKELTTGHTVLMGRKTFESIGKPLPNRRNIVITSHAIPLVETFSTIPTALSALQNEEKVFVIGGEKIFQEALLIGDELLLTVVENNVDGDTFFPPYEYLLGTTFILHKKEERNGYLFLSYLKKKK